MNLREEKYFFISLILNLTSCIKIRLIRLSLQTYRQDFEPSIFFLAYPVAPYQPGLLVDLGVANVSSVNANFVPPQDEQSQLAWQLAWNFKWQWQSSEQSPVLTPEQYAPFEARRLVARIRAVVGHSYLLRMTMPGKLDHLLAFSRLNHQPLQGRRTVEPGGASTIERRRHSG